MNEKYIMNEKYVTMEKIINDLNRKAVIFIILTPGRSGAPILTGRRALSEFWSFTKASVEELVWDL